MTIAKARKVLERFRNQNPGVAAHYINMIRRDDYDNLVEIAEYQIKKHEQTISRIVGMLVVCLVVCALSAIVACVLWFFVGFSVLDSLLLLGVFISFAALVMFGVLSSALFL